MLREAHSRDNALPKPSLAPVIRVKYSLRIIFIF
jgi:hypothetical protein